MSYLDIEPIPEEPKRRHLWPMWAALILGMGVSLPVDLLTNTVWGMFGYLPWLVILLATFLLAYRDHRRWNRAMDGWEQRMHAYYDAKFKRVWS